MKIPPAPHRWNVTPREAIAIQKELAASVRSSRPKRALRLVAGVDMAFSKDGTRCIAGAVLWDTRDRSVVEEHLATRRVSFPYVPGLLSFRETPAVLLALRKLRRAPDALMCDGHGLAHPRRFGIACHVGVIARVPTLGCAKSRLVGEHSEPGPRRGSKTPLTDRGEVFGTVLRTRDHVRPVFVSVGHLIDLATAERVVLESGDGFRLPEPTRRADRLVAAARSRST